MCAKQRTGLQEAGVPRDFRNNKGQGGYTTAGVQDNIDTQDQSFQQRAGARDDCLEERPEVPLFRPN